ncbi:MAG: hypothetical protein S4CHLAM102_09500 [Chlamydiia bacterium]|nr:hypothetical protein [Chlamydiia bacterium]
MNYSGYASPFAITPKPIKVILFLILLQSIVFNIFDRVWNLSIGLTGLTAMSSWGLKHGLIFQVLTNMFLYPLPYGGLSFTYLLFFALNLYLIWKLSSLVYHQQGKGSFFALFFGSGIAASLAVAACLLTFDSHTIYAGLMPIIYAFLTSWIILFPDIEILLFMTLPVKARWAITLILGSTILIELSNRNFTYVIAYMASAAFGYLFAVGHWKRHSPFITLRGLETTWITLYSRVEGVFRRNRPTQVQPETKIYDFRSGKPIMRDEEFINWCLDKMARDGKNSLSLAARLKLWIITRKLQLKNKLHGR